MMAAASAAVVEATVRYAVPMKENDKEVDQAEKLVVDQQDDISWMERWMEEGEHRVIESRDPCLVLVVVVVVVVVAAVDVEVSDVVVVVVVVSPYVICFAKIPVLGIVVVVVVVDAVSNGQDASC
jgi:hypothetical protein